MALRGTILTTQPNIWMVFSAHWSSMDRVTSTLMKTWGLFCFKIVCVDSSHSLYLSNMPQTSTENTSPFSKMK